MRDGVVNEIEIRQNQDDVQRNQADYNKDASDGQRLAAWLFHGRLSFRGARRAQALSSSSE